MHYFSAKNLLLHHPCHSISSIFCFQRLYRFVRNGRILLGHLCNLSDWGLSCEWWLSEGRTMRATAATLQNVIRSRIGLIAVDSFLEDYGRCRPPTILHLLVFTQSWALRHGILSHCIGILVLWMCQTEEDLIDFSLSCCIYTNK